MIAALLAFVAANMTWLTPLLVGAGGLVGAIANRVGLGAIVSAVGRRRELLVLVALAAAAAFLWWRYSAVAEQRDSALAWMRQACAIAGASGDCLPRLQALAAFERDTLAASNRKMAEALADGRRKTDADLAAAARAAREMRDAAELMEKANGEVGPDDRVGGDWFAGLNRLAGLRGR